MTLWTIVIGGILMVMFLIPFTSVRIRIAYQRRGEDDRLTLRVRWLWGLVRYRWQADRLDWTGKGVLVKEKVDPGLAGKKKSLRQRITLTALRQAQRSFVRLKENVVHLSGIIRYFVSRMVCEKLVWVSSLGTGDAAETGVITGLAWGIKSSLVGIAGSYLRWRSPPRIDVRPHFTEKRLETDLECIIRFRVGHAMLAGLRLFLRMDKGGEGKWQNTLSKA